jgi:5-methyltetrahydropteroyltriglutamate--homocysteine methyltransferase
MFAAEIRDFPDYHQDYFARAMMGGTVVPVVPLVCTGPVEYRGHAAVQRDIANL